MQLTSIIRQPIITEKSLGLTKLNRYTFSVHPRATKHQIKQAVEQVFSVNVVRITTSTKSGLIKRTGKRRLPRLQPDTKKAIVELKAGQKISIFETQG